MSFNKYFAATRSAPADLIPRALETLSSGFASLVAGSRTIPLGDNGVLIRDLAARVRSAPVIGR